MVFSWEGIIGVIVAMREVRVEWRGVRWGMQEVKERNNKVISGEGV